MLHLESKSKRKRGNASLRALRTVIGCTQRDFAKMVGVSVDLVKGIECGRNALSHDIAGRIQTTTGADARGLLKGKGEITFDGRPYELKTWQAWSEKVAPNTHAEASHYWEKIVRPHMKLLLMAASRKGAGGVGAKHRLHALFQSWSEWEQQVVEQFNLSPELKAILSEHSYHKAETRTWDEWRKSHDFFKTCYKFKNDPRKNGNESLTLKATWVSAFSVGSSLAGEVAGKFT